MKTLPGYYQASGAGWYLAKSLQILASEIATKYPQATCLGTIGDQSHQDEGTSSDHNPFVTGLNGQGVVRAIDIGGPDDMLKAIRQFLWNRYAAHDGRMWQYGYAKGCSDDLINNWPPDSVPGSHVDTGDAGHLHISVTRANTNNTGPSAYSPAIDSTGPWGLVATTPVPPTPIPHDMEEDRMFIATLAGHGSRLFQGGRGSNLTNGNFKNGLINDGIKNYPVDQKQWDELENRYMHNSTV